jgi:hypothetical protein
MLKRMLAVGLTVGLAAVIMASCGGNNTSSSRVLGKGALYTFIGDTPASDVLSLRTTVTGLTLKEQGTTNKVTVFPSSSTTTSLVKMNFASLRDFATVLTLAGVPDVTYDEVTITFSGAQIVVYDPANDPPIRVVTVEMSTSAPVIPIQPALTIVKDKVAALRLDFDMLRSIKVDAHGQVSGKLTPILKASPVVLTEGQGYGEFDDLVGFVRTVMAYPISQVFTGAFTVQTISGTGPALTVNLTSATQLYDVYQEGVPALNKVETGRLVEVDAMVDENGNLVAKTVEFEDRAVVADSKLAFLGYVIAVTKDNNGNVTQFSLFVREEEPDASSQVPLDSVVVVNVAPLCAIPPPAPPTPPTPPSCTTFLFSSRPTNFAGLPFDARAVAPGQELIVHGKYTRTTDQPTTVDANMIYLKLQTVQGNLGSLVQVGSDDKTGAFWLTPSSSLLRGAPILVFTTNTAEFQTAFVNVFGLAGLTPQAILLVRGLPFYQTQAGTINGVAVPAGTLVITARQIHQLQ